jgi:hypothetical protein
LAVHVHENGVGAADLDSLTLAVAERDSLISALDDGETLRETDLTAVAVVVGDTLRVRVTVTDADDDRVTDFSADALGEVDVVRDTERVRELVTVADGERVTEYSAEELGDTERVRVTDPDADGLGDTNDDAECVFDRVMVAVTVSEINKDRVGEVDVVDDCDGDGFRDLVAVIDRVDVIVEDMDFVVDVDFVDD